MSPSAGFIDMAIPFLYSIGSTVASTNGQDSGLDREQTRGVPGIGAGDRGLDRRDGRSVFRVWNELWDGCTLGIGVSGRPQHPGSGSIDVPRNPGSSISTSTRTGVIRPLFSTWGHRADSFV